MRFSRKTITQTLLCLTLGFSSNLLALDEDILTQYKNNGIKNITKILDQKLTDTTYWKNYLKNKDTNFGYIESYINLLICNKAQSKLTLYTKINGTYTLRKGYSAFTGKLKGDKKKEGDLKTPVGVYNLIRKLEKVDSFYGPMAFVTSYPNLYDKYQGKTGQGIWIHGLPTDQERDEFTKGCIAIKNQSLECLNKDIAINKTLLIINEAQPHKVDKTTLSTILAQLYSWRYSWIYNDLNHYLDFYDAKFKRFDGMDKKAFSNYKKRIFSRNETKTILFTNLNVIPYPDKNETYKITFNEQYKTKNFKFQGNKILIVQFVDNKIKIITEK